MRNNLPAVEKNLQSIAKRYESVKYSVGLAVLFLMKGTSVFSDDNKIQELEKQKDILTDIKKEKTEVRETEKLEKATPKLKASWVSMQFEANNLYSNFFPIPKTKIEKTSIVKNKKTVLVASADNSISLPMFAKLSSDIEEISTPTTEEINTSKENLRTSIGDLQNKIDITRKENTKEVEGLKLELVQLMEQGDQVVKSPWSSWQFGANYMYNDWREVYKGRGDKLSNQVLSRDSSGSMNRFLASSSSLASYGSTDLFIVPEPDAEIKISAGINPKIINRQAPSYTPSTPEVTYPTFEPRFILSPIKPSAPAELTPTTFEPPDIKFKGTGFHQYSDIGIPKLSGANVVIQNYDSYNTVSNTDGTTKGIFNIEVGTLAGGAKVRWWGSNLDGTANPDIQMKAVTNVPNVATPGLTGGGKNPNGAGTFYLGDGNVTARGLNAFINELRDHDAIISGNYVFTNRGGENRSANRIFLSHNPAGVGGGVGTSSYDGHSGQKVRTATFNGNLTLHGTPTPYTGTGAYSDVTIGVEHQYWTNTAGTYSIFDNTGNITLASGNNLVGILIDIERNHAGNNASAHKTVNNGLIEITGAQNSIGIDYGEYENWVFKSELTVGNVIVGGKKNYGLRMSNIYPTNPAFFDKGTTIKSGGADKKVLVKGTENVGISIAKFLSSAKDTNPIAGIVEGLNIEVAGEKNLGFLRHKSYVNNTGDMIFNNTTMGTFTFGNGAKDSTLIRTDKHGIQVRKDISAIGKDADGNDYTGSGNTVLHANGQDQHIYNYNTITVGKGFTQTVGMAATGTATATKDNILNEGTIALQGKKSIGMYTDKFSQGKSTGSIKLSGIGDTDPSSNVGDAENIGISNKGKFTFLGDIEVNGKKSSGIFNTGITTIEVGTNPTDKTNIIATNGATALYSKGAGSSISSNAGDKLNIAVNGGTTKEGLAIYAEDKGQITLHNANINVVGGSAGVAAYDTNTKIDLTGAILKYDGNGYAAYSDGKGQIILNNANIELRGRSTLMNVDLAIPAINRPIKTSATNVTVFSNDVVGINIDNLGTQNVSNLSNIKNSLGITLNPGTEGGQTFNKFKELAIDDGIINFDVATDRNEGDSTAGGFFFKKVLGQRLKLNVNENLTARLSSTTANEFYNGQVVGLEANSSDKATTNTEAQVNIAAGKIVDVARTDGTDKGGVGIFVNYGQVNNRGTINVEKDSVANSNAVGVYAVNGSEVTNNRSINVGGEKSIGLLGIAYRMDMTGKIVVDEFGTGAIGQGKVNIVNKGSVDLDGQGAIGMFVKNNKTGTTFTNSVALNDTTGLITTTGTRSVGMAGETSTLTNRGIINVNGQVGTGIFGRSNSKIENDGTINIASSNSVTDTNIGIFTEDQGTEIYNNKDIIGANNTYGIYGKTINMGANGKVKVGDNSVGIYSNGQYASSSSPNVTLASGSSIEVGNNQSVGVFLTGQNQNILSQTNIKIGDDSFGYVIKGTGTKLTTNAPNPVTVGNDTTFIYSTDTIGNIENRTKLTSTGNKNYGIYAAGNVTNLADIDFSSGIGNVGVYSIAGGKIVNGSSTINSIIKVGSTDKPNKLYGIGMVAGYTDDIGAVIQTGTVENYGTIKVEKDNGIGMYATGSGSKAINRGTIELSGKNTTGMHLDNNAVGENYGTIKTVPNPTNDGIVGVSVQNGAIIKNYGNIIIDGANNTGIYLSKGTREGTIPTATNGAVAVKTKVQSDTSKKVVGIEIKAPGNGTATVSRDGKFKTPTFVDTTIASPMASRVIVGTTELDLTSTGLGNLPSVSMVSEIGMYVDTSGVNYTNPIQGLQHLTAVKDVNLIFGTEASRYTTSKDIKIGENILKPYNDEISNLTSGGTGKNFNITSGSLTWIATGTQNQDDTFNAVYLSKLPYTAFAKDKNTYNFMDGLEQRYGVEGINSREKALFDKLNAIGKGEPRLFAQAVDQMKGNQYANAQQRVQATGNILDKEFSHLRNDWSNLTKDSNKIKTFGARGEYKTNTTGIEDYKSNAYGVAYIHEDETVRQGESLGWYVGMVHNTFKFKDLGNSKEEQLQGKLGIFKSVPFDENNSLNWTISGDVFAGYNKMNRKFLVVDEVFNAKGKYHTYGLGIKNELGKEFRLSESFTFRPYAALGLEYGRVSKIREKSGEMKLEVKANDYFSVKPEIGTELGYRHHFVAGAFKVSVGVAYENELGRVANVKNKAKVANTSADWYSLRNEKEDRRGNVKTDFNVGWDNQRIGVTANVGYDTKGHNTRAGVGLRVIF
ncbi:autotransporter-associated N-terminal domain-containing protein [Fusobacterium periodonticum]|uniref:Outer membrane autotransporter barrel domain protein n=1 Tax=Fusobacterium periodonticum ATCC 33693 TaxID=546275 RepID=D4CRR7_9FUSO|nr:autotransporter-associated N-terminal domain-containing protein [Fusobacterium periodonticum]EFE87966.1 outer membrane autotransporter barrel domain protein [Fusobacterium periodonticum ATCC 33693]